MEPSDLTKEKENTMKSVETANETKNEDVDVMLLDTPDPPEVRPTSREGTPTPTAKSLGKRAVRFISPDRKNFIDTNGGGTNERGRKRTISFASPPQHDSRKGKGRATSPYRRSHSPRFRTATSGKVSMTDNNNEGDCDTNAHKRRRLNRLWPAKVQSIKSESDYSMSPMINSHTVEKQAEAEPNFVGDGYFYKLTKPAHKGHVEGEYTVVYTRPVGKPFDPAKDSRCVVFPPSDNRIIKVWTTSRESDELRRLFREGNYAIGEFVFKGTPIKFHFFLDPVKEYHQNKDSKKVTLPGPARQGADESENEHPNAHKTTFRVRQWVNEDEKPDFDGSEHPQYAKHSELMKILNKSLGVLGHTITFGLKAFDDTYENNDYHGFHFIEMELACAHPVTGAPDHQLIVAVKMPTKEVNANVSSHLLLKQELTSNHDLKILNGDPTMAWYHQFSADEIYGQPARWRLNSEEHAGLMTKPLRFNAGFLESHLLLQKYPIEELEKILNLLNRSVNEGDFDERKFEAISYATNRLEGFKQEHTFREQNDERRFSSIVGVWSDDETIDETGMFVDAIYGQSMQEDGDIDLRKMCEAIDRKCAEGFGFDPL